MRKRRALWKYPISKLTTPRTARRCEIEDHLFSQYLWNRVTLNVIATIPRARQGGSPLKILFWGSGHKRFGSPCSISWHCCVIMFQCTYRQLEQVVGLDVLESNLLNVFQLLPFFFCEMRSDVLKVKVVTLWCNDGDTEREENITDCKMSWSPHSLTWQ